MSFHMHRSEEDYNVHPMMQAKMECDRTMLLLSGGFTSLEVSIDGWRWLAVDGIEVPCS
jgi:hypothetical protein